MQDLVDAWAEKRGIKPSRAATELLTLADQLIKKGIIDEAGDLVTQQPPVEMSREPIKAAIDATEIAALSALIKQHIEALDIARVGRLAELVSGLEKFADMSRKLLDEGMQNVSESAGGIERASRDFIAIQKGAEEARSDLQKLTQELGESTKKSALEVTEKLAHILDTQERLARESRSAIEESKEAFRDTILRHESAMDSALHRADQLIEKVRDRANEIADGTGRVLTLVNERQAALEKAESSSIKTIRLFQTRALATVVISSVLINAAGFVYTSTLAPEIKAINAEAIAAKAIADHSAAMAQKFDEHFSAVRAAQDEKMQKYFAEEADRLAAFQRDYRKEIVSLRTKVTDTEEIARSWHDRAQFLEAESKKRKGVCGVVGGGSGAGSGWVLGLFLLPLLLPLVRRARAGGGRHD